MPVTWLLRFLVIFTCCFSGVLSAATLNIEVSVDRNPIIVNESFNLIVSANEDLPRWAFNSQALLRDFIVGGTSMETLRSVNQGVSTQTTRWSVRLTVRSPGTYTIPAFTIEGHTTQPIEIEVVEASTSDDGEQRPFFIQAELSNITPYVQQQFLYKVELYLQANTPLDSGTITTPEAEHADIELITQNRERQEIINGQRYRVITQEYGITPQRSGPFTIKGAVFNGIYRSTNVRSLTGFSRPEQVTLHTPDKHIQVQAKPENFPGTWLVSEQVTLEEEWESDRVVLSVGEPITRTIILTAEGVRPEQLPDLNISWPNELRIYPERPQQESSVISGMRIAQARHTIVIIPSQTGTVTLPEVEIPWFNSRTNQTEYARLPARELSLTSPPGGLLSPQAQPFEQHIPVPETSDNATKADHGIPVASPAEDSLGPTVKKEVLLIIVSLLWLLTAVALIWVVQKLRRARQEPLPNQNQVPIRARDALNALKRACHSNNNRTALQALVSWQQARYNAPSGLNELRRDFAYDPNLIEQLDILERSLYSAVKEPWLNGKDLWTAIARLHSKTKPTQAETEPLNKGLYPHH